MKTYNKITFELLEQNKGKYIRLGGKGILDGLKMPPSKFAFVKIEDRRLKRGHITFTDNMDLDNIFDGVYLKRYRHKKLSVLPSCNFDQTCQICSAKDFKKLPIYS